ncbi:unnamed protein product [Hanseniaspora opuntiae]|uniref:Uncharacterized protein n=1 Tax=Hanseniaspora opuntiae TaxID=211096 RepID=A0A1E5RU16_9ASCO|nr:hypothetical protein AWRI3578_g938 [Hanseniaspora opuntiae]
MNFLFYILTLITFNRICLSLPIVASSEVTSTDNEDIEYVTEYITQTVTSKPTKVVTILETSVFTTSVSIKPTSTFVAKII